MSILIYAVIGFSPFALFGALLGLSACMRSSEISREEERGYLFEDTGAPEGAWPTE